MGQIEVCIYLVGKFRCHFQAKNGHGNYDAGMDPARSGGGRRGSSNLGHEWFLGGGGVTVDQVHKH